jgi:predicted enzyme related to lactoylglutathione lyase
MTSTSMRAGSSRPRVVSLALVLTLALAACRSGATADATLGTDDQTPRADASLAVDARPGRRADAPNHRPTEPGMRIEYLEIVTAEVDAVCAAYATASGVTFGEPVAALGNARTAALSTGGRVGVRAPMHEMEEAVTRPYWLVDDIEAAVAAAVEAGAEVAHPPLEIPGEGTFAIYFLGGVQHALWQR